MFCVLGCQGSVLYEEWRVVIPLLHVNVTLKGSVPALGILLFLLLVLLVLFFPWSLSQIAVTETMSNSCSSK